MSQDCPLCLEPLAIDDVNFFPCECRYQICRFCWHRIRTDEDGRCPHCRLAYSENPAEYIPLTSEQLSGLRDKGKKKNQDKKQKLLESRKNLADVRVVQRNLVFVIGLSPRLADPEVLKKLEYFGKYGKIFKVVINNHTVYSGQQGPSVSAYVTYVKLEDASKAIQAVNNAFIDGRYLKASYGTTKYCSFFLKGIQCTKQDCMYLHELGESDASFTKEDMQLGKHQEYEQAALTCGGMVTLPHIQMTRDQQQTHQIHSVPVTPSSETNNSNKQLGSSKSSKPRPRSVHESALPSSANWGSKGEGVVDTDSVGVDRSHSGTYRHGNESRGLHRTMSYPVKSSSHHSLSTSDVITGCHDNKVGGVSGGELEFKSPENALEQSRLDSPSSLSSSVESIRSHSSSSSSINGGCRKNKHKTNSNKAPTSSKPHPKPTAVYRGLSEPMKDHQRKCLEGDGGVVSEVGFGRGEEEKENWDLDDIPCSEGGVVLESDEPSVDVFKSLGSAGPGEFGSLGVSWCTKGSEEDKPPPTSGPAPSVLEGPEYMPMAWDPLKGTESTILAAILSRRTNGTSPPKPHAPVDEKQRLVSASYVNYGPTTNNGDPDHHRGVFTKSHGDGMLQSTLNDGFKTLFPNMRQRHHVPQQQGFPTSHIGLVGRGATPIGNNLMTGGNTATPPSSDWPDLKPQKSAIVDIAPPPGFGPPVPKGGDDSPSTTTTDNTYSLWGGNSGGSSLQGLFQQAHHGSHSHPTPKPPPVSAIPANILEASLFSQPSQHKHYQGVAMTPGGGGVAGTPTRMGGASMTQQQAMLQQQQMQQLQRQQQQMYLQQQQQLRHTHHQMYKAAAGVQATPTNVGTHPPNGYTPQTQRPPTQYNMSNYYGGWAGPFGWGVSPHITGGNYVHNNTGTTPTTGGNGKLVNPVQWTGHSQPGLNPALQQQHSNGGLNLKH